jgi:hypothetical protein
VIEEPSAVWLPSALDEMHGIANAWVGLCAAESEVVQCAENVVVVARREREFKKLRIGDLTSGESSEEPTIEQVLFAALSGRRHELHRTNGALVLQQTFEYADRCIE